MGDRSLEGTRIHSPQPSPNRALANGRAINIMIRELLEPQVPGALAMNVAPDIPQGIFTFRQLQRGLDPPPIHLEPLFGPRYGGYFKVPEFLRSEFIVARAPFELYCRRPLFNPYFRSVACFLQSPPPAFSSSHRVVGVFPVPTGGSLVIFKRVVPVSLEELDATVAHLHLAPRYVTSAAIMAADFLEDEGHVSQAARRLKLAGAVPDQPPKVRRLIMKRLREVLDRETGGGNVRPSHRSFRIGTG